MRTLMVVGICLSLIMATTTGNADQMQDEAAIKALNDTFVAGFLAKDPKKRASIWAEDGDLVPPNAGYLKGRDAIEKYFVAEGPSVTESSKVEFSNYRFDFLTPNLAFVDADLTLNNIMAILAKVVFVAERRLGKWWIRNERAHFVS